MVKMVDNDCYDAKLLHMIDKCETDCFIVLNENVSSAQFSYIKDGINGLNKRIKMILTVNPVRVYSNEVAERIKNIVNGLTAWRFEEGGLINIATLNGILIGDTYPYPLCGGSSFIYNWRNHSHVVKSMMGKESFDWEMFRPVKKRISNSGAEKQLGKNPRMVQDQKCWTCYQEGHKSTDCPSTM